MNVWYPTPLPHMDEDIFDPPNRGRPRSRRRAVTDPFHAADTSGHRGASKRFRGKVAPAAKRLRYTKIALERHVQQNSHRPVGRIIPLVKGPLPASSRRPGKPPMTIATKHQQHQSPEILIGSVININDPDDDISRDRLLRGLYPLYPSPTPEVPQSTFGHKVRPTSGDAVLTRYLDIGADPDITHVAAGDGLPVNEYAGEEQPGNSIPQSKFDSMPLLSKSMEEAGPLEIPFLNLEAINSPSVPPHWLSSSVVAKTSSPLLAQSHYTISQDHTAGEDNRTSSLLAGFPKRGYSSFH